MAVGLPLGILISRWVWRRTAEAIYVRPALSFDLGGLVVALSGIVLVGSAVAALAVSVGRRHAPALALRGE
jgi:hypothetical protein